MTTTSLSSLLSTPTRLDESRAYARADSTRRADDFSALLGRTISPPDATPEERARKAAEQIVAVALVQPILKQLRESSQAAPPFAPTQGEKQFQSLMDAQVAQQVVGSKRFALVDRIQELMLKRSGAMTPSPTLEVQA